MFSQIFTALGLEDWHSHSCFLLDSNVIWYTKSDVQCVSYTTPYSEQRSYALLFPIKHGTGAV